MVSPQMRPCHKPTAGHSDRSKYNLQQNRFKKKKKLNMHCKLSAILYHVWASYYIVLLKLCLLVLLGLVLERTSRWWLSVRPTVSHRWTHTASMKKLDARLCPFQSAFLQHTLYLNRSVWREHSEQSKLQQHPPVFTSLTRHCSSPVRIFQSER